MKFYEVMSQIVLTSHLVGFDLLTVSSKVWNGMTPEKQATFQAAADEAIDWSTQKHLKREAELAEFFKEQGPRRSTRPTSRLPRLCAEDVPGVGPRQAGPRACSTRSTRSDDGIAVAGAWPAPARSRSGSRLTPGFARSETGCAPRRECAAGLLAIMFVAFIVQIVFRYLFNFPIGWTSELTRHHLALAGAVGRGLCRARARRDPLRPHLRRASAATRAGHGDCHGRRADRPLRFSLPAVIDYVTFMKVQTTAYLKIRFDWLFSIYVIFAVAVHRPLCLDLWRALRGDGRRRSIRPRPAPGYESRQPFSLVASSRSSALGLLGLPIGHAMIGGSILYLCARRPRHGHRRRAAAERHVPRATSCSPCRSSSSPPRS